MIDIVSYSVYKLIDDLEKKYGEDLENIIFVSRPLFSHSQQIDEIIEQDNKIFVYVNLFNMIGINGINDDQVLELIENDLEFANIIQNLDNFIVRTFYSIYKNNQLLKKYENVKNYFAPLIQSKEYLINALESNVKISIAGRFVDVKIDDQAIIGCILTNKILGSKCWINDHINIEIESLHKDYEKINKICDAYHGTYKINFIYTGERKKLSFSQNFEHAFL